MQFQPRPYQITATDAVWRELQRVRSTLVVSPTGTGKTVLFSILGEAWEGPVLVLAHRQELLRQAQEKLRRQCREAVGIDQGAERAMPWGATATSFRGAGERIVCGSVQTLAKAHRLNRYDPAHPWLVIVDEAHHATAKSYEVILRHFLKGHPGTRVVGVTATPKRTDRQGLIQAFESAAFVFPIRQAIEEGWLVDVEMLKPTVTGLDFSKVSTVKGDLNSEEIADIATQEGPLHEVAAVMKREIGDRQGIVYCANTRHVQAMTGVLRRYFGDDKVAGADGKTDDAIRKDQLDRFRGGSLQLLVNCALYVEGLDVPAASVLAMCRPTKSLVVYTQTLGRIMRPLEGLVDVPGWGSAERQAAIAGSAKPLGLLLDFCGISHRHKLVDAVDVLYAEMPAEQKEAARQVIRQSREPVTFDQAAHQAALEEALLREQIEWRKRAGVVATAEYRVESLGTLSGNEGRVGSKASRDTGKGVRAPGDAATDGQIRHLIFLGVSPEKARGFGKKQAAVVINRLRAEKGLPLKGREERRA